MYKGNDSLGEAAVIFSHDASSWHSQIKIDKAGRDKTAFASHHGLNWFIWVLIGQHKASSAFQQTIDVIPLAAKRQFAHDYLNNIFALLKSSEEHNVEVRNVLNLLRDTSISLELKKCHFFV